jgi:hypothetical protein
LHLIAVALLETLGKQHGDRLLIISAGQDAIPMMFLAIAVISGGVTEFPSPFPSRLSTPENW